jgi:aspartyl-tRNA(Asn)/glutamyl-tRNA(Gln) amidotransferase subunit C
MKISKEEIKHVAELARLKLTIEEEEKFGEQIESVLQYVEKLNEVDTKNIPITAQVSGLVNVTRADNSLSWSEKELKTALDQADIENGYVKVKRVL